MYYVQPNVAFESQLFGQHDILTGANTHFPQEIIKKDEEITQLRKRLKQNSETLEEKESSVQHLGQEIEQLRAAQETMEKSMESEKASALQVWHRTTGKQMIGGFDGTFSSGVPTNLFFLLFL